MPPAQRAEDMDDRRGPEKQVVVAGIDNDRVGQVRTLVGGEDIFDRRALQGGEPEERSVRIRLHRKFDPAVAQPAAAIVENDFRSGRLRPVMRV